ncbi:hypothetical protein Z968_06505 [Clostridium novyi A str. 4552]|uniref:HD domain-containing protein n=1 Tax=Clostridium novyi A str. 4552 TaxID=1444289 RepID=A0A0A0I7V2_CLONO|nr:dNTP triphosphohydrolase [Clostridium novyi]KGM96366.1 hypothetical protein Z968_06505 [Clostridium novyi A str. 4552]
MDYYNKSIKEIVKSVELEEIADKYICEWGIKHKSIEPNEKNLSEETNRTYLRRQRDRILYTGGFRRLQGKTQVISATKNGDHRTRLTHSLEVEQIAVSIADALSLNRDLVSAIALGHDVGHTPFGHAVERFLDRKLECQGGFSHAVQSVRYLKNRGVKLSYEVIEGILKHDTDVYAGGYNKKQFDCAQYNPSEPGSLESQVVYWSDKLAYLSHDFEDFYKQEIYNKAKKHAKKQKIDLESELQQILSEIIPEKKEEILKDIENFKTRDLIRNVLRNLINESFKNINQLQSLSGKSNQDIIKTETKKRILDIEGKLKINGLTIMQMKEKIGSIKDDDEIKNMEKNIKKVKKEAYQKGLLINFDENYGEVYLRLRKFLNDYYIDSPEVQRSDAKAEKIVETLYEQFISKPKILPLNIQEKLKSDDLHRIVADYIASMTDRYAEEIFMNLSSIDNHYYD